MENLKSIYWSRPIGMKENFRHDAVWNCTDLMTGRGLQVFTSDWNWTNKNVKFATVYVRHVRKWHQNCNLYTWSTAGLRECVMIVGALPLTLCQYSHERVLDIKRFVTFVVTTPECQLVSEVPNHLPFWKHLSLPCPRKIHNRIWKETTVQPSACIPLQTHEAPHWTSRKDVPQISACNSNWLCTTLVPSNLGKPLKNYAKGGAKRFFKTRVKERLPVCFQHI